jgi:flagellar hook-associated protein 1 FlgK
MSDTLSDEQRPLLVAAAPLVQERSTVLSDAARMLRFLFVDDGSFVLDADAAEKNLGADAAPVLEVALNSLASVLATEINQVHRAGFGLDGSTGADFFTGTTAADIKVNDALLTNAASVQASGVAGAMGDNQIARTLAQLAEKKHASLNNQTFSENYGQTVAALGESLASTNGQLGDQRLVEGLLQRQRDSIGGVSLDEEMTELMKFQKAYQASARLITTVDEMLNTIMNM